MKPWLEQLVHNDAVDRLIEAARSPGRLCVQGAWGSSTHLLAGALHKRADRPVLLLLGHLDDAAEAVEDLNLFGDIDAVELPALEVMPGESHVSLELLGERLGLITRLHHGDQPDVVVAPIQSLMQAAPQREALGGMTLALEVGREIALGDLTQWLVDAGYQRVDAVDQPGDFAIRGGIVDVLPPGNLPAVRIDFFGDQIDTLSEIDLDSMGSGRRLDSARLINASVEAVQSEERTTSVWSLLREDTAVVIHEVLEVAEQARGYYERLTDDRGIYNPNAVLKTLHERGAVEVSQFAAGRTGDDRGIELPIRAVPNFEHDASAAVAELGSLATGAEAAGRLVVLCAKEAERDRLAELIEQNAPHAAGKIELEVGYLHRGFVWADESGRPAVALIPHHELFHRYHTRRRLRRISTPTATDVFLDLEPGDVVVHREHGIARFRGMRTMDKEKTAGGEEYLTLEFDGRALLHVPVAQIELVQKYIGGFQGRPPLSKLGGKKWQKQKEQTAEAVRDMAAELLRVQAARASLPGVQFPADDNWMKQFEAEFPYEETDDQLATMVEIKRDMTSSQPMDRLICGDVGYGKTELAMRAAFKAVEAGKQVALLCPTTVLCEQHERTFRQRMADYPVSIDSISRFKAGGQQTETLARLREGRIDIIIGTHRLLSEDIEFSDLGMVIVDEEQRFGVEHKSRLMRFRVTVDVLTLSATPIPRTLHMSMLGLRDISSLATPPADRRAIVTEVIPYDKQRIRTAVLRELNRGGQCYFVHNRVHNIHQIANELRTLAPEAKFVVGHGQMHPRELEAVMLQFLRGEADVLVSTTIIESGIDIPTANTMFIHECDRFGLAEMHQLRGRVGRYKHRAYCYMLLPRNRTVTEVAMRRLRAIEDFSMLGAGFKIAMRDMEIRGVGNILGPEQSGHIAAVGYDLYCRLLEDAVSELKNEPAPRPPQVHLELGINGALPKPYIVSEKHRMEAYRRLARAGDIAALREVEQDLVEAYGELPEPAQRLVALAEIRTALGQYEVEALKIHESDLIFTTMKPANLYERLADAPGSVRVVDTPDGKQPGTVYYRPPANYLDPPSTLLAVLRKLLVRPLEAAAEPRGQTPAVATT